MTEKEKSTILDVVLNFNFCVNYINALANRKTDEREEIIAVCNTMKEDLKKLIPLL